MKKKIIKQVFIVASDGPCGTNLYGAFSSKKTAENKRDEMNTTRHEWDHVYIIEMRVR